MLLKCDLHIHSCLSPCGSLDMSPSKIAETAVKLGLQVIAVADHNTAKNAPALEKACRGKPLIPLFAIEATTSEEFHALCLFPEADTALRFGDFLYSELRSGTNIPSKFGDQVYVDDEENILGELDKYLTGGALPFSSDILLSLVHSEGGLFIPAHMDRAAFSITSQLGFLPPDPYDALEITLWPPSMKTGKIPLISNSDAHFTEDMGKRWFNLECEGTSPGEIMEAIKKGKTSPSISF